MKHVLQATLVALALATASMSARAADRPGEIKGTMLDPSPANLALTWDKANLVLPPALVGWQRWEGTPAAAIEIVVKSPLVIFLHASNGIAPLVKEFQNWLADALGLASVAPDSLAIPDRLTYTSPVPVEIYERVHTLRLAELEHALRASRAWSWVDRAHIVLADTSEGAAAVSRYAGAESAARLIYAWSCESNYFVSQPRPGFRPNEPVLDAISVRGPYFSARNRWNRDYTLTGSCAAALNGNPNAVVDVVDADVHTILNRTDVREATVTFLKRALK